MKVRWVQERIGEWLGPVDWSYDFHQHSWDRRGGSVNPKCIDEGIEWLRRISETGTDGWRYRGFPVAQVGMYDGWPFWKPTPAIQYIGPLGCETAFFYNLHSGDCYRATGKESP